MNDGIPRGFEGPWFACLAPLLGADLLDCAITWHYSVDRGWWPAVLLVMLMLSILYAGVASATIVLTAYRRLAAVLFQHVVLGLALVAVTLDYYLAKSGWLAAHSDDAILAIYLCSYLILLWRCLGLRRRN